MPWKGETMESKRETFVKRVISNEQTKSALCQEYGISRPTGDKWIKRYSQGESMADRSRRPFKTPNRVNEAIEAEVVSLRKSHPALGAKKLKRLLEDQGKPAPAYSTINAILHRNNLITPAASAAATPHVRFEKAAPNEMWQADFKGSFLLENNQRCYPLTVLDDHSRYSLCIDAKEGEKYLSTRESFERLFCTYGLPQSILCDNGNPWGTAQSTGLSQFEVWLMDLGILTIHCKVRRPQTQGKEERFNGTLKRELLNYQKLNDMPHAQQAFDEFKAFYNTKRPHHALGLDTPATRYTPSNQSFCAEIPSWTYPSHMDTRTIKKPGYLTFHGKGYFLSESLGGRKVGLEESMSQPGLFHVVYRGFRVATVDVDERAVTSRKVRRWPET